MNQGLENKRLRQKKYYKNYLPLGKSNNYCGLFDEDDDTVYSLNVYGSYF